LTGGEGSSMWRGVRGTEGVGGVRIVRSVREGTSGNRVMLGTSVRSGRRFEAIRGIAGSVADRWRFGVSIFPYIKEIVSA
jgi:hypothetical protein